MWEIKSFRENIFFIRNNISLNQQSLVFKSRTDIESNPGKTSFRLIFIRKRTIWINIFWMDFHSGFLDPMEAKKREKEPITWNNKLLIFIQKYTQIVRS